MIILSFLISLLCAFLCLSDDSLERLANAKHHHFKAGRERFLFNSSWPSDHGDSARSKYSIGYGLPEHFDASKLKVLKQPKLKGAQWLYTQGEGSKYLYLLGGGLVDTYLAKVDSVTLEVLAQVRLPSSLYLGGLLMHSNGHVYAVHQNVLYAFWNGDLANVSKLAIPTRLNKATVQTNGMIVTQDGYLVVKQWPLIVDDLLFYASAAPPLVKLFYTLLTICATIATGFAYSRQWWKGSKLASILLGLVIGLIVGLVLSYLLILTLLSGIVKAPIDPWRFAFESSLFGQGSGGGELKFIDPISLTVVAETILPDRCSVARMSLVAADDGLNGAREDILTLLGDELAFQYRWLPETKSIIFVKDWTKRYRKRGDGSFQATGAATFNNVAYFTDNTFPVFLSGQSYRMFNVSLSLTKSERGSSVDVTVRDTSPSFINDYVEKKTEALLQFSELSRSALQAPSIWVSKDGKPGFMFWSVVASPLAGDIIVWDTAGKSVQSRSLDDLNLKWEVKAWQADCLTVSSDRGHVYLSDYSDGPSDANAWMPLIGKFNPEKRYQALDKFFVVVSASTGKVLANVTVAEAESARISMIIPGANQDVFLGTAEALVRVFLD